MRARRVPHTRVFERIGDTTRHAGASSPQIGVTRSRTPPRRGAVEIVRERSSRRPAVHAFARSEERLHAGSPRLRQPPSRRELSPPPPTPPRDRVARARDSPARDSPAPSSSSTKPSPPTLSSISTMRILGPFVAASSASPSNTTSPDVGSFVVGESSPSRARRRRRERSSQVPVEVHLRHVRRLVAPEIHGRATRSASRGGFREALSVASVAERRRGRLDSVRGWRVAPAGNASAGLWRSSRETRCRLPRPGPNPAAASAGSRAG